MYFGESASIASAHLRQACSESWLRTGCPMRPLRFTPPSVSVDSDLAWLLRAAFANDASPAPPHDATRALELARATQLSGRVAARLCTWRGAPTSGMLARELSADYFANIARESLLKRAMQQMAQLAADLNISLIAVKFAGLQLIGAIVPGTRVAADLDVLLPKPRAREFWHALLGAGFRRTRTHEYAHQLEALIDPYGAVVDLHVHLPGVTLAGGKFATAEQLIAQGLVNSEPVAMLVPDARVLAAHAIVHALIQNRSTPQTYSPMRLLADLMDLRRIDADLVRGAARFLSPELAESCHTLDRLCVSLGRGSFAGSQFDHTAEQTLLWHCLAARLSPEYAARLRAAGLSNKFRDGSGPSEIVRYVADLIYPAEAALDFLYGPAHGIPSRIRRRLLRPIDLATTAARRALGAKPKRE